MLLIECPFCGPRDEPEFACAGEAHLVRPDLGSTDEAWGDYLFTRANPRGPHRERWVHVHGCGLWFNVERDTLSHAVLACYPIAARPPEVL